MKLRRDIASVPHRTGTEAWSQVIALITRSDSIDADQLEAARSVMASLLTEEHYADHGLTLKGDGHRLVIYFAYGSDAVALGDELAPLEWNPTAKGWTLFVPCDPLDLDWVRDTLKTRAPRLVVHALDETPAALNEEATASAAGPAFAIDWGAAH